MGHGLDVHRRIDLRWLSSSRRKEVTWTLEIGPR
jgi:hypothetical protein